MLPNLLYKHGEEWLEMPAWCNSYIELGMQVEEVDLFNTRHVFALAVPTRSYAAMFIAFGIVMAGSAKHEISEEYIQFIREQPIGTPVVYQSAQGKQRGVIEEFSFWDDRQYITIKTGQRQTHRVPLRENVAKISIADHEFKLPDYQKGGKSADVSRFLSMCIEDPTSFVIRTQLECIILGRLSTLETEITQTLLAVQKGQEYLLGTAQDVLRVKKFLGLHFPYRCQVMPATRDTDEGNFAEIQSSHIVIFDGANAYLRHGSQWPKSHHIVILDRTERAFPDAVANINQGYIGRLDHNDNELTVKLPSGVEMMVFKESIDASA